MAGTEKNDMSRPVPTLTVKLMQKTLGKKKKVIRNTLLNPHPEFWPELSENESQIVLDELQRIIKEPLNGKNKSKKLWRRYTKLGVNDVSRSVEKYALVSVLLADDVSPKSMMQHVITLCTAKGIPALVVKNLRSQSKIFLGFSTAIMGFKTCIANKNHAFYMLHTLISELAKLHEPPAHMLQFKKPTIDTVKVNITSPKLVKSHKKASTCNSTPFSPLYLYKTSTSKAFIPPSRRLFNKEKSKIEFNPSDESGFISFGTGESEEESNINASKPISISHNILNPKKKLKKPRQGMSTMNETIDTTEVKLKTKDVSCRRVADHPIEEGEEEVKEEESNINASKPIGISHNILNPKKKLKKPRQGMSSMTGNEAVDNTEVKLETKDVSCRTANHPNEEEFISLGKYESEEEHHYDSTKPVGISYTILNPRLKQNNFPPHIPFEYGKRKQNNFPPHIPFKYARVQPKPRTQYH